jgi:segregation and condensation protein B
VDEKDEPKDEPVAPQPAAPGAQRPTEPGGPGRPSALEAWRPGQQVEPPDDVGEVHAIEDVTREEPLKVPAGEPPVDETSVLPAPQVRAVIEALVFASPQPITPREIARVLQGVPRELWQAELAALVADYARDERGLQVVEVAGGHQITTRPEYNDWVRELLDPRTPTRLSIQALETLAVIAYKQPVTLPEIIELRGVKSGGVVKTLLEKRLIRITGRKEVVGRPILYGTTKQFLLHFGLKSLDELPKIEEFAEVLGEEVDIVGLKRAIESPLPIQVGLSDPDGEQMPLFEAASAPPGAPPDGVSLPGGDETPSAAEAYGEQGDAGSSDEDPGAG